MHKHILLIALFSLIGSTSFAQADSLMSMLDAGAPVKKEPVTATFKATRIINSSSVENLGMGILDFRIDHRFGQLNEGAQNFFGVDNATTKIAFDYGVTNWLMVGLAHDVLNKEDNGFLKIKLLRQKINGTPVTVSYVGAMSIQTTPVPSLPSGESWLFSNRLYYAHQILIARKFTDRLSLQLMPTVVHYNLVDSTKFSNNTFAIGVGGRIKVSRRVAITGEYFYRINNTNMLYEGQQTYNSLSVGVDIETGGHVFQMMLTNSQGMTERAYIGQTTDSWSKGAIHFGFNISRVFTVVKPREFRDSGKTW
jgi:hypothetical protein